MNRFVTIKLHEVQKNRFKNIKVLKNIKIENIMSVEIEGGVWYEYGTDEKVR